MSSARWPRNMAAFAGPAAGMGTGCRHPVDSGLVSNCLGTPASATSSKAPDGIDTKAEYGFTRLGTTPPSQSPSLRRGPETFAAAIASGSAVAAPPPRVTNTFRTTVSGPAAPERLTSNREAHMDPEYGLGRKGSRRNLDSTGAADCLRSPKQTLLTSRSTEMLFGESLRHRDDFGLIRKATGEFSPGRHSSSSSRHLWTCMQGVDSPVSGRGRGSSVDSDRERAASEPPRPARRPPPEWSGGHAARKILNQAAVTPRPTRQARAEVLSAAMRSAHFEGGSVACNGQAWRPPLPKSQSQQCLRKAVSKEAVSKEALALQLTSAQNSLSPTQRARDPLGLNWEGTDADRGPFGHWDRAASSARWDRSNSPAPGDEGFYIVEAAERRGHNRDVYQNGDLGTYVGAGKRRVHLEPSSEAFLRAIGSHPDAAGIARDSPHKHRIRASFGQVGGKDHFISAGTAAGDEYLHGHRRTDTFEGGIERNIGAGKRHIAVLDHFTGTGQVTDVKSPPVLFQRGHRWMAPDEAREDEAPTIITAAGMMKWQAPGRPRSPTPVPPPPPQTPGSPWSPSRSSLGSRNSPRRPSSLRDAAVGTIGGGAPGSDGGGGTSPNASAGMKWPWRQDSLASLASGGATPRRAETPRMAAQRLEVTRSIYEQAAEAAEAVAERTLSPKGRKCTNLVGQKPSTPLGEDFFGRRQLRGAGPGTAPSEPWMRWRHGIAAPPAAAAAVAEARQAVEHPKAPNGAPAVWPSSPGAHAAGLDVAASTTDRYSRSRRYDPPLPKGGGLSWLVASRAA